MLSKCETRTKKRDSYDTGVSAARWIAAIVVVGIMAGWTISYFFFVVGGFKRQSSPEQISDFMSHIGVIVGNTFLTLTILLFMSITAVIWRLRVRQRRLGLMTNFVSEVKNLIIILLIFSFSFLARYIIDTYFYEGLLGSSLDSHCLDPDGVDIYCYPYKLILWVTTTQYLFDFIPIAAIYLFHYHNFRGQRMPRIVNTLTSE